MSAEKLIYGMIFWRKQSNRLSIAFGMYAFKFTRPLRLIIIASAYPEFRQYVLDHESPDPQFGIYNHRHLAFWHLWFEDYNHQWFWNVNRVLFSNGQPLKPSYRVAIIEQTSLLVGVFFGVRCCLFMPINICVERRINCVMFVFIICSKHECEW